MKVFDVTFAGNISRPLKIVAVFAEDAAQATRIAVRTLNKERVGKFIPDWSTGKPSSQPLEELTAEDVVKVEVIRDQVAS